SLLSICTFHLKPHETQCLFSEQESQVCIYTAAALTPPNLTPNGHREPMSTAPPELPPTITADHHHISLSPSREREGTPCSRMHQPPRTMASSATLNVTGAAAQAVANSTVHRRDRRCQSPQLLPSSFFAFEGGSRLSPCDAAAVLAGDASSPA
ncbi:hypothetical protein V8G54_018728, partial [Vigna mungo]